MIKEEIGREYVVNEIEGRLKICRDWDNWSLEELMVLLLKLREGERRR